MPIDRHRYDIEWREAPDHVTRYRAYSTAVGKEVLLNVEEVGPNADRSAVRVPPRPPDARRRTVDRRRPGGRPEGPDGHDRDPRHHHARRRSHALRAVRDVHGDGAPAMMQLLRQGGGGDIQDPDVRDTPRRRHRRRPDPVSAVCVGAAPRGHVGVCLPARLEHLRDRRRLPGLPAPVARDAVPALRRLVAAPRVVRGRAPRRTPELADARRGLFLRCPFDFGAAGVVRDRLRAPRGECMRVPQTIGRYEILGPIGSGGMGTLLRARDPKIGGRTVAIKLLKEGIDNDEIRRRFMQEANAAGVLEHENIVRIFDVGEQDGEPFIAMEYIDGETLSMWIRRKEPASVTRKLRLLEELCDGLAYAHSFNIVHRDVKPSNLIVERRRGRLKILDFGIAKLADSGTTNAGALIGSFNYMSPEQVRGLPIDDENERSEYINTTIATYCYGGAVGAGRCRPRRSDQPRARPRTEHPRSAPHVQRQHRRRCRGSNATAPGARFLNDNVFGVAIQLASGIPGEPAQQSRAEQRRHGQRPSAVGAARNSLALPARKNVDARYSRRFRIQGNMAAEIIAEVKNLFNTEQVSSVNADGHDQRAGRAGGRAADVGQPADADRRLRTAAVSAGIQVHVLILPRTRRMHGGHGGDNHPPCPRLFREGNARNPVRACRRFSVCSQIRARSTSSCRCPS